MGLAWPAGGFAVSDLRVGRGRVAVGEGMVKIKKGDTVVVIRGDDRGAKCTVHRVIRGRKTNRRVKQASDKNRVVVSGINIIKKHQRRTGQVQTQVGIIEREAPLHVSNVALFCGTCNGPAKIGYQVYEDGSKARYCKRCGDVLD